MKKNMIVCLFWTVFIAVFCPGYAHGQKLIFIFAHALYDIPVDNYFKNNYNYGAGVEGGAGIGAGRTFFIGTVGYTSFNTSSRNNSGTTSYVPIKGGIRHYLLVGKILFITADAGVGLVKNNVVNNSSFSGDLGLGVKLGPAEVLAQYNGYTRSGVENSGYSSWIELKAGVRFGL